MRNVAEESGTAGSLFAGFPIQVAGKTGTAENFGGTDHGWFVAYAPCWKLTSTSVNTPKAHRRIKTRTAKKKTTRPIRIRKTGKTTDIAMGLSLTDKS